MPSSKAKQSGSKTVSASKKKSSSSTSQTDSGETLEENVITIDRRRGDRRSEETESLETDALPNPRRKKQRRRHIDPTTCERDYSDPEIEFMRAMDDYKRASGRMFPTCSEVLEVVRGLGYVRLTDEQIEQLGLASVDAEADAWNDESSEQQIDEESIEEETADA